MTGGLQIDPARLTALLAQVNEFGVLPTGGVQRLAWTDAEVAARGWLLERCRDHGLRSDVDEAGNVWAWGGTQPAVVMGSHLDTVPRAGRFDGALGVLAALTVLATAKASGLRYADRLAMVCFTDEEGVRFSTGMTGSRAVVGTLTEAEIRQASTADGQPLRDAAIHHGLDPRLMRRASRRRTAIAAYLELHIEQGRQLADQEAILGIVDVIVGLRSWHLDVHGQRNHAGTTALPDRRDALVPVAVAVLQARQAMHEFPGLVATVGHAAVVDGASNILPGEARCTLDVRSTDPGEIETAAGRILAAVRESAGDNRCVLDAEETKRLAPVRLDPYVTATIEAAAADRRQATALVASMAGHDAMNLAGAGIPSGMIFAPSRGGLSHCPEEYSSPEDCVRGAELMGDAALRLAANLTAATP